MHASKTQQAAAELRPKFWQLPLEELTQAEWEALCDGCGLCCLHKLLDESTEELHYTDVACDLLNLRTGSCRDYENRRLFVPDCISLQETAPQIYRYVPATCAYKLRHNGEELPSWHYLLTGDKEAMRREVKGVQGRCISESCFNNLKQDMEDRIITWVS